MSDVKLLVGILEKIANICKDNIVNTELTRDIAENVFQDGTHDYELVARKKLSQEIFDVINKGLNDSKT